MRKGGTLEIFIYRVPYHRALKTNIEFSIVCSYLRKIIRQSFAKGGVYALIAVSWTWHTAKAMYDNKTWRNHHHIGTYLRKSLTSWAVWWKASLAHRMFSFCTSFKIWIRGDNFVLGTSWLRLDDEARCSVAISHFFFWAHSTRTIQESCETPNCWESKISFIMHAQRTYFYSVSEVKRWRLCDMHDDMF